MHFWIILETVKYTHGWRDVKAPAVWSIIGVPDGTMGVAPMGVVIILWVSILSVSVEVGKRLSCWEASICLPGLINSGADCSLPSFLTSWPPAEVMLEAAAWAAAADTLGPLLISWAGTISLWPPGWVTINFWGPPRPGWARWMGCPEAVRTVAFCTRVGMPANPRKREEIRRYVNIAVDHRTKFNFHKKK